MAANGRSQGIDGQVEIGYRSELRRLEALAAELDRELLRCRSGLTPHYDELSRVFPDLRELQSQLTRAPAGLGFMPGPELSAALVRVSALSRDQQQWLESFQTENTLLRSSRQSLSASLDAFRAQLLQTPGSEPVTSRLTTLLAALAQLDVAPTRDAVLRLSVALDELERAAAQSAAGWSSQAERVLQQGRRIAQHLPRTEELLAQLLSLPLGPAIQSALESYQQSYQEALGRARLRNALLAAFSVLALALGLWLVLLQLRSYARALRCARYELRVVQSSLESTSRSLERERSREREQRRLEARFVSATSQELRTPLTSILSSSRMLSSYGERWSNERRQEHYDRISAAAVHMKEMLEELLVIGRAEVGKLVALPGPLDLRGFCQQLIDTLARAPGPAGEPLAPARRVRFSFRGERKVCLDHRLLTHVLGNLLENALAYSRASSEVGLHVSVGDGGVRCVVQDAGVGISAEELPKLFQTFRRGRNVGNVPGSGLGLAVARRAVQAQGGKIEVHSAPGKGSEFVVWLPLAERPSNTGPAWANDGVGIHTMEIDPSEIELMPLPGGLSA
jgi:signal transduction histidine kinase